MDPILNLDVAEAVQARRNTTASVLHHPSLQDEWSSRNSLHDRPLHQLCGGHEASLGPARGPLDPEGRGPTLSAGWLMMSNWDSK